MIDHVVLTAVQARILLTIFLDEGVGTAALIRASRISGSAWAKQSALLTQLGLLTSEEKKILTGKRIRRIKHYRLTGKGNQVAKYAHEISMVLGERQRALSLANTTA